VNKTDRIKPQIDVAVRKLAESIRRDGGLASVMQGGISGVEGTRIHQHFLKTAANPLSVKSLASSNLSPPTIFPSIS
jgi:hypothetical protein